jgi:hypothetical protein
MAVTTTAQDIYDLAYPKSQKNRPGVGASESGELLRIVERAMRGLYGFAARVNPTFFADEEGVAANSGWDRPERAEAIFMVEFDEGANEGKEVVVVPFDDRRMEHHLPAIYEFGQRFRSAGNPKDPTTDALRFYFSIKPKRLDDLETTLDPLWLEEYNELLAYEVAIYLALKDSADGRAAEIAELKEERKGHVDQFGAHLEHATTATRRRFIPRFATGSIATAHSLLAGGA